MSAGQLRKIRQSRNFFKISFRKAVNLLIISLMFNGALVAGIYLKVITKKQPDFYASSGEKAPIKIKALSSPNYSSKPLLKNDRPSETEVRELPEI